jgi:hypothetical protein
MVKALHERSSSITVIPQSHISLDDRLLLWPTRYGLPEGRPVPASVDRLRLVTSVVPTVIFLPLVVAQVTTRNP